MKTKSSQPKPARKTRDNPLSRKTLKKRQRAHANKTKGWKPTYSAGGESWFNATSQSTHDSFMRLFSNLRFSLGLRISANYARLLLSMYLSNVLVLFLVFCIWQTPLLLARQAELVRMVEAAEGIAPPPVLPYADMTTVKVLPGTPAHRVDLRGIGGQDLADTLSQAQSMYLAGWHPMLVLETPILQAGSPYRVQAVHDLAPQLILFAQLMGALLVFDLWRALAFLYRGRRINRRVLQPIADITAHAQMLSENDLSLRLNVAGAKNELRDLAMVLNAMLDRIEAAYNGQKQFVSDASHELRTPIAVIQGYANLLARWGKDDTQVRDESIAAIVNETASMKDLVEKLLFLARHDKKTFKLNLEHFELRELVEETVRETEMITANHQVETGELTSGILYADRNAIKQAIRVFIDNAVKYTPPGGTIRVACQRQPGTVVISVSDTGIGISRADLASVFDRFYRADTARNGKTAGHGLGLAIARIIVTSHGGKIQVTSKKDVGSTFRILLPN